jgi:hypothetical protein
MKPTITTLGFGGALFAAALLVACGGGTGSGSGSSTLPGTGTPVAPSMTSGTTKITIQLPPRRTTAKRFLSKQSQAKRRAYVAYEAGGLQIAVTAGGATQTVYANIASPSPLCTNPGINGGNAETCTLTVPNVGASETIVATEVDATPSASSATTGYGTGFPATAHILAVGTRSASNPVLLTGSTQQVTIGLNPVDGQFFDYGACIDNANFGVDNSANRIVVTAGVAASGQMVVAPGDAADYTINYIAPSPLPSGAAANQPFVDVNGSSTPITLNANSADVTLAIQPSPNTVTPAPLAQSVQIADTSTLSFECVWLVNVSVSATLPTPAPGVTPATTMTVANNLTATLPAPFVTASPNNYGSTLQYLVVPIYASPSVVTVSASGSAKTVTGTDYLGDMAAESAYGEADSVCLGSSGLVTLTPQPYSNGQTQMAVTTTATTTGTCTFYMYDPPSGVVTNQITVNYGP